MCITSFRTLPAHNGLGTSRIGPSGTVAPLIGAEMLINPRAGDEIGDIFLVAVDETVSGPRFQLRHDFVHPSLIPHFKISNGGEASTERSAPRDAVTRASRNMRT